MMCVLKLCLKVLKKSFKLFSSYQTTVSTHTHMCVCVCVRNLISVQQKVRNHRYGCDPNYQIFGYGGDATPLFWSLREVKNNIILNQIVRELLVAKADVDLMDGYKQPALFLAAKGGNYCLMKM